MSSLLWAENPKVWICQVCGWYTPMSGGHGDAIVSHTKEGVVLDCPSCEIDARPGTYDHLDRKKCAEDIAMSMKNYRVLVVGHPDPDYRIKADKVTIDNGVLVFMQEGSIIRAYSQGGWLFVEILDEPKQEAADKEGA